MSDREGGVPDGRPGQPDTPLVRLRSIVPLPTWRMGVVAVAAAPLLLVVPLPPPWGLIAVNLALLLLLVGDAASAPDPQSLQVERSLPEIVPLHDDAEIVWRVTNPLARPISVALADELSPSLSYSTRRVRMRLPPRGRMTARASLRPQRRGRFELSGVVARVEGRLGLAARQGYLRLPAALRVYPPFRSRYQAELRIEKGRILEVGLRSAKGRGGGTDFDSLREYVVDDEFRRIDWAATARSGKAIVRQYRAERNQTVLALLDVGRVMAGWVHGGDGLDGGSSSSPSGNGGRKGRSGGRATLQPLGGSGARLPEGFPRLDHAMDAVMALTTVTTHLGDRLGLLAFGAQVRAIVPPRSGPAQLGRVTEALYRLEPELAESDYQGAFLATLARFQRRALIVLLSELAEEALTASLLPALPVLVRDHVLIMASVHDPQVEAWARGRPQDVGAVYRKAAALRALEARRHLTARLTNYGVTVVDAPPDELPGRLSDAYLNLKVRGRI